MYQGRYAVATFKEGLRVLLHYLLPLAQRVGLRAQLDMVATETGLQVALETTGTEISF